MARRYIGVSFAAALSLCLMGAAAQAQVKIVFNSFAPPTFVINQGMIDVWAKNVERVTEGRVKIEIPATSLAPPPQQWEMVTQGVADGAYIFLGFAQKRLLLPQLATLPFGTPSATAQAIALWRTHKRFFEKANESEGVVLIGYFGSPAAYLWSADKPIAAVGDLKDVKTWSLPGDQGRALAALGAVIVPGPAVRSYEIISKGIVAAWGGHNFDGSASFNVTQYAKSVTLVPGGIGAAAFAVFLNKAKWDSIPKRDQDLIMSVSGEEIAKLTKVWDNREAAAFARAKQEGRLQITTASPQLTADLQKSWAFLQTEWIANAATRKVDGPAALKYYLDTVKELSR